MAGGHQKAQRKLSDELAQQPCTGRPGEDAPCPQGSCHSTQQQDGVEVGMWQAGGGDSLQGEAQEKPGLLQGTPAADLERWGVHRLDVTASKGPLFVSQPLYLAR